MVQCLPVSAVPSMPSMSLFSSDWKLVDDDDASFRRLDDVRGKPDGCGAEWNSGKWKPPSTQQHIHTHTYIHTYIHGDDSWYSRLLGTLCGGLHGGGAEQGHVYVVQAVAALVAAAAVRQGQGRLPCRGGLVQQGRRPL